MDERMFAKKLEVDLRMGPEALSKARMLQAPAEYRRILELGLRMTRIDFSAESESRERTLRDLADRYGGRRPNQVPRITVALLKAAGAIGVVVLVAQIFLHTPAWMEGIESLRSAEPSASINTASAQESLLPEGALRAINAALAAESSFLSETTDPDLIVPTRITEVTRTILVETSIYDPSQFPDLDPFTAVWVVKMTGKWLPREGDPVSEDFRYGYIEAVVNAETYEPIGFWYAPEDPGVAD